MFARVTVYELPGDRIDEAAESFQTAFNEIAGLDGFREGFFLVCADDDRATAVTLWETRNAMEASRVTASRVRTDAARSVEGSVLSAQEYDVAIHAVADRAGASR